MGDRECAASADTADAERSAEQVTATPGEASAGSRAASSTNSPAESVDDKRRSDAVRRLHEAMRGYPPLPVRGVTQEEGKKT